MATLNHLNPGYHDITTTLPDGSTETRTVADDGTWAYTTTTPRGGSPTVTYNPKLPSGEIATPTGPGYKRTDGFIVDGAHATPTVDTSIGSSVAGQVGVIEDDPADAFRQLKDQADKLDPLGGVDKGLNDGINDEAAKVINKVAGKPGDGTRDDAGYTVAGGGQGSGGSGGGGFTGTLSSLPAVQEADDFAKKLLAERDAARSRDVPQAAAGQVDLSKIPQAGPAATYGGSTTITPSKVERVAPASAGGFSVGGISGGSVEAGQIDTSKNQIGLEGEARDAQVRALSLAEGAANGTAPSAAQALLRKGVDEGVGAQLGVAASLQGRNPGAAMRAGLAGAADVTARSATAAATLKADEMAQARRDFLAGAGALRNSDVDVQKANQSTILQANLGNLSADTQAKIATLAAQTEAAKASLAAQVAAGQANLAAQTQISIANLQAETQRVHDDAYNELQGKITSGQLSLDAFKATLAANTSLTQANIDAMTKTLISNAGNTTQTNIANAGLTIESRKLDDLLKGQQGDQIIAALGLPIGAAKQDIANSIAAKASSDTFWASVLAAIGTYAAAA